jgi:hypothetical protein
MYYLVSEQTKASTNMTVINRMISLWQIDNAAMPILFPFNYTNLLWRRKKDVIIQLLQFLKFLQ